ncbi:MAG: YbhB/YbcL family Raf kinase inhibitor-like protein [Verrucomicrobiaceae bacterium]|nr:YbhB/YbcL family Raf kinase inhibitor-like protein [Verrucomicrobiaceae bacterium]
MKRGEGGGRGGKQETFVALPDQPRSSDGKFMLNSPVVEDLKNLPIEFTGDGVGISPPLEWIGAPSGTQSFALIMDHVTPDGDKKWYWTIYDIPSEVASLPKDSQRIGKLGTGFKGDAGYEPPHSKGPGAKTYVITMYALSGPLKVNNTPGREELIAAMKDKVLASSSLRVVHSSGSGAGSFRPRREPMRARNPKRGRQRKRQRWPSRPREAQHRRHDQTQRLCRQLVHALRQRPPRRRGQHSVHAAQCRQRRFPARVSHDHRRACEGQRRSEDRHGIRHQHRRRRPVHQFADGTVTNATWKAKTSSTAPSTPTPRTQKSSKSLFLPIGGPWTSTTAPGKTPRNTPSKKSIPNSPTSRTTSKVPSSSGATTSPSTTPSSSAPRSKNPAGRQDGTRSPISM